MVATSVDGEFADGWKPLRYEEVPEDVLSNVNDVIDKIPPLPVHVQKILKIVSDIDSDAQEIAKLASSDPVLVSKILTIVNSSYYGLSQRVDDLRLAIVLLGFSEIRKIALQSGFSQALGKGNIYHGYDTRNLWFHSYQVSVCCETLAPGDKQYAGTLLTMGLLHDIGKFVLYNIAVMMKRMGRQPAAADSLSADMPLMALEEKLFRVNHCITGELLAKKWGLPERIWQVVKYHHYPSYFPDEEIPEDVLKYVAAVSLADLAINEMNDEKTVPIEPPEDYYKMIGFKPPIDNLLDNERREKIKKAGSFLLYIG